MEILIEDLRFIINLYKLLNNTKIINYNYFFEMIINFSNFYILKFF